MVEKYKILNDDIFLMIGKKNKNSYVFNIADKKDNCYNGTIVFFEDERKGPEIEWDDCPKNYEELESLMIQECY